VRTIRFCSVICGVTSSLAVIHTIHVHRDWQTVYSARPRLIDLARYTAARRSRLVVNTCRKQKASRRVRNTNCGQQLLIARPDNHWLWDFSLPRLHSTPSRSIAILFGTQKTRMVWLPGGEKNRRYLYSFWHNAQTWHTHTHTQTLHDGIGRAYA